MEKTLTEEIPGSLSARNGAIRIKEAFALDAIVGETFSTDTIADSRAAGRESSGYLVSLHRTILERCRLHPHRVAIMGPGFEISYGQLRDQVLRVSAALVRSGVGPGTRVAVCTARTHRIVVALLAILQAGAAYIPIDSEHPADRISWLLDDSQPLFVLTDRSSLEKLPPTSVPYLCLEDLDTPASRNGTPFPEARLNRDAPAYVIYTSGTTGRPKGVVVSHGNLANQMLASAVEFGLTERDTVLALNAVTFDIAAIELFLALTLGARVAIIARSTATDGHALSHAIEAWRVSFMQATPSVWRLLLESGWKGNKNLRIASGGESLPLSMARELLARTAGVWNVYGPTETAVAATAWRLQSIDNEITIGRPLLNYSVYILNQSGKLLRSGEIGELYIGGAGVAIGYWNRPDLTAGRFLPDPFKADPNARMYRSGDLGRILPDGNIQLLGRLDNQVKFRGYRIELEEIEAVLDRHPSVGKSVVLVNGADQANQRLTAFLVPAPKSTILLEELRAHSARVLPTYMVPSKWVSVDVLPLTPHGKIDREAVALLADEIGDLPGSGNHNQDQELETLESELLKCWRTVLQQPDLGCDSNFFDAGGHSLLAARLFSEISRKLGQKLPPGLLMEGPTVRLLAARIRELGHTSWRCIVELQPSGNDAPLYLVHHLQGDVITYRSLANHFAGERPVLGIQVPRDVSTRPELRNVEKLAALYVRELLEKQSTGPFHIAGYSSGGHIALEMAVQLRNMGHQVGLLVLIDAENRSYSPPLPPLQKVSKMLAGRVLRFLWTFKYELRNGLGYYVAGKWKYVKFLYAIKTGRADAALPTELTMETALLAADQSCVAKSYERALLVRAADEARKFGPNPLMGWSRAITGQLDIVDVAGSHGSILDPEHAGNLASVLRLHLSQIEAEIEQPVC